MGPLKNGKASRMIFGLDARAMVGIGRADIDLVITEFGVAQSRGKYLLKEQESQLFMRARISGRDLKQGFLKTKREEVIDR